MTTDPVLEAERLRRWRLILGGGLACPLCAKDGRKDTVLGRLYNRQVMRALRARRSGEKRRRKDGRREGGMGLSMPDVYRWLGDIREYFPESVALVMQQDAVEAVGLKARRLRLRLQPAFTQSTSK